MKRWLLVSLALTVLAFACSAWIYWFQFDQLPPRLPIHWDLYGQPNGWVARDQIFWSLFLMPTAMALIMLLTVVLPWLSPRPFDLDRFRGTYAYVMMLMVLLLGYMHRVNVSVLMILLLVAALLAVRVRLLSGLLERFAGHVARVEMVLSRLLLARLLLFRILVVGHGTLL